MIHNIILFNDMGHLQTDPGIMTIPKHILDFVFEKVKLYVYYATDNDNLGCRFYVLKDGLNKEWTYYLNNDVVNITYNLNTFDNETMRRI